MTYVFGGTFNLALSIYFIYCIYQRHMCQSLVRDIEELVGFGTALNRLQLMSGECVFVPAYLEEGHFEQLL